MVAKIRKDLLRSEKCTGKKNQKISFRTFQLAFWKATQGLIRASATEIGDYVLLMPTIAKYGTLFSSDLIFQ